MAKAKTQYVCQNCGASSAKWIGKCPSCGEWNTYVEELSEEKSAKKFEWDPASTGKSSKKPEALSKVLDEDQARIICDDGELTRVLGGGIVPGSLILIGGEPGIGKSTLLLQVAMQMKEQRVLYVSGEESARQIKLRANRLGKIPESLFILTETSTSQIFNHAKQIQPDILVVDSIQTLHASHIESTPGSISQIRECTGELQRFAKETHTPVFIIGHINKEGHIAGPKVLEHMVDTVLQFEGERNYSYRILRTTKNRFGSTSELGIYEMRSDGLREVSNPSEILIPQREEQLSGIAVSASVEGVRPMLIEVQALVAPAFYGTPQRTSTGFDTRRLNMLLAVLEKRGGFQIGARDVFVNIAGGLKVDDPAIDLAVVAALMSSYEDRAISTDIAFAGEVGLSGEVRAVPRADQRIAEAEKLGFKQIFLSRYNQSINTDRYQIELKLIGKVHELYRELFG